MGAIKTFTIARRRAGVTPDQLAAYWRSPHAENVVEHMRPDRYTLSRFDPRDGAAPFDGMAELRYDDAERAATVTGGNIPAVVSGDGWADLVELPTTWARVREHVVIAGPSPSGAPATVEEREAAFKLTFLLHARDGVDRASIEPHWLDVHVPNFAAAFVACGGVRYVIGLVERATDPGLVGVAELSYRDRAGAQSHQPPDDGFTQLVRLQALPGREHLIVP